MVSKLGMRIRLICGVYCRPGGGGGGGGQPILIGMSSQVMSKLQKGKECCMTDSMGKFVLKGKCVKKTPTCETLTTICAESVFVFNYLEWWSFLEF